MRDFKIVLVLERVNAQVFSLHYDQPCSYTVTLLFTTVQQSVIPSAVRLSTERTNNVRRFLSVVQRPQLSPLSAQKAIRSNQAVNAVPLWATSCISVTVPDIPGKYNSIDSAEWPAAVEPDAAPQLRIIYMRTLPAPEVGNQ